MDKQTRKERIITTVQVWEEVIKAVFWLAATILTVWWLLKRLSESVL